MKTFIMYSGGKDSTASVILAHEHKIQIDGIVFCEVMYDKTRNISGEQTEHIDFVFNVAKPMFESWGMAFITIRSDKDFLDLFNHKLTRSHIPERVGMVQGWFLGGRCLGNRELKMRAIHKWQKAQDEHIEIVGIAYDEQERLKRLGKNKISLLAKYQLTELQAKELCERYNLLSPIYKYCKRSGCLFCPNQSMREWAATKINNPILWQEFKELSNTPNLLGCLITRKYTFAELDKVLDNYIERQRKFCQMSIFDL